MVKNLPAMWETQARSLGREDPLEEGMATRSSILAWRIHGQRRALHGVTKSRTRLSNTHTHTPKEGRGREWNPPRSIPASDLPAVVWWG